MNTYVETEYTTVRITVTPAQARGGCLYTLRYPGAPAPLPVEFPGGMKDGAVLFVSAPFLIAGGITEERPLRVIVHVEKKRGYGAVAALMLVAAAALVVMILLLSRDLLRGAVSGDAPAAVQFEESVGESSSLVSDAPAEASPSLSAVQLEARALIPHFELRYFLNQLDDRLLANICAMYRAVSSFETQCSFPEPLTRDELSNLALLLSYECPELLQFSVSSDITFYNDVTGNIVSAQLPISMTHEQYEQQYAVCSGVASVLAKKAAGLSEYEKELLAYDYLTANCFYSLDAANAANAYGALGDREAKCDGISLAMKWLCEEMGIACMVISGENAGNPIGHAWNIVCIDGTYYDLDVTNDVNSDSRRYSYYGAFNVSRYWIRSKYPENVSFSGFLIIPGSESMNMSYHARRGSFVNTGAEYEQALFDQLDTLENGQCAYLQFESWDDYTAFVGSVSSVMGRWSGLSKGSFNYSLSRLDDFQVCLISVSYV